MAPRSFISVGIVRSGEISTKIAKANVDYRARAITALNAAGLIVQNAARRSVLDGPKTGIVYKRGNVEHRASAPGQAPASDTGRLASSIVMSVDDAELTATITAGTEYAKPLEFGTTKMAARPFLGPALTKNRARIVSLIRQILSTSRGR